LGFHIHPSEAGRTFRINEFFIMPCIGSIKGEKNYFNYKAKERKGQNSQIQKDSRVMAITFYMTEI
jgi:hypothetical protein